MQTAFLIIKTSSQSAFWGFEGFRNYCNTQLSLRTSVLYVLGNKPQPHQILAIISNFFPP